MCRKLPPLGPVFMRPEAFVLPQLNLFDIKSDIKCKISNSNIWPSTKPRLINWNNRITSTMLALVVPFFNSITSDDSITRNIIWPSSLVPPRYVPNFHEMSIRTHSLCLVYLCIYLFIRIKNKKNLMSSLTCLFAVNFCSFYELNVRITVILLVIFQDEHLLAWNISEFHLNLKCLLSLGF